MKNLTLVTVPIDSAKPGEAYIPVRSLVQRESHVEWVNELGILCFRDTENPEAPLEPVLILPGVRSPIEAEPANDEAHGG